MGVNIGTSMTNTLVSVAQSDDRSAFRRAFAGATVHDMFNILTVLVLLPLEVVSGYLFHLTSLIVSSMNLSGKHGTPPKMLQVITEPLTDLVIQLDKTLIENIAVSAVNEDIANLSLVKRKCGLSSVNNFTVATSVNNETADIFNFTVVDRSFKCHHLFANIDWADLTIGSVLLILSLIVLISCLMCIVKLLNSMLQGHVASLVHKTVNYDLPGCFSFLTGYLAILVGAVLTILVQSSSVFTSALTPLVGLGVLSVERMYPLTLGANVGTTFTSILAALASPPHTLANGLQVSMCHLFFNITGILLFYPVPFMRNLPISLAKLLGNKTAKYRWIAVLYILVMFFLFPAVIFGLSMAGTHVLVAVGTPCALLLLLVIVINIFQHKMPRYLPICLRDWNRLPKWMHSLEPLDHIISSVITRTQKLFLFPNCGWSCCRSPDTAPKSIAVSESRTKLLYSSRNVSRVPSISNSPSRSASRLVIQDATAVAATDGGLNFSAKPGPEQTMF
ncbi:unnamed protein product [Soboliphyme baturini]|uniref:Sodium-dependent phosphate transport protein 2B n=1 Tax=Soboliphyme baturini TaxID=241478 RepID=A0A183IK22_9BILA|nr:unnamed protein product [Soboliphyme baturini]